MTRLVAAPYRAEIGGILAGWSDGSVDCSDGLWRFVLRHGPPMRVSAALDDPFLLIEAPSRVAFDPGNAALALEWNAMLPGPAKFAIAQDPWQLLLRAEIPIDEETIACRIANALDGLRVACTWLENNHAAQEAATARCATLAPAGPSPLFDLLRETGWPFLERPDGTAAVELALRGEACRVQLAMDSVGLRVSLELLQAESISPRSRLALSALLLCASGSLRMSRPFASDTNGLFTCGFEVRFETTPSAFELEFALEALAVVGLECKAELHSLLDNTVAESYLAIRKLQLLPVPKETHHG